MVVVDTIICHCNNFKSMVVDLLCKKKQCSFSNHKVEADIQLHDPTNTNCSVFTKAHYVQTWPFNMCVCQCSYRISIK